MATADYDVATDSISVLTEWNQKSVIKQVPGARWDANQKLWRVPAAWASVVILRGLFGADLVVGERLKNWSWHVYDSRIGLATAARNTMELIDDGSPEAEVIKSWRT